MNAIGLRAFEVRFATHVGAERCLSGIADGRSLGLRRTDQGFDTHTLGAVAEYALAKHLNVCWVPQFGALDTEQGDVDGYGATASGSRSPPPMWTRSGAPSSCRPSRHRPHARALVDSALNPPVLRLVSILIALGIVAVWATSIASALGVPAASRVDHELMLHVFQVLGAWVIVRWAVRRYRARGLGGLYPHHAPWDF